MKNAYLTLAVLGGVLPCIFFEQFIMQHGLALPEFTRQLFTTSPAAGFTVDVLISSAVFWIWSYGETRQYGMKNWWLYVVLNLSIGLSCALPLFLYFRQDALGPSRSTHRKPFVGEAKLATGDRQGTQLCP